MLFEIISLLQDCASRKPHVCSYMRQIATDHVAFKVIDRALYAGFLAALVDEMSSLLGDDWTAPRAAAWARQSGVLLQSLPAP
jgi:hemoglobin-like flavoprotein